MKLVYSRNQKPIGNTTPGMEFSHVRDEPERIVHVLDQVSAERVPWMTLCRASVADDPVPNDIVLPTCANCFSRVRRARAQIEAIKKRVGI